MVLEKNMSHTTSLFCIDGCWCCITECYLPHHDVCFTLASVITGLLTKGKSTHHDEEGNIQ